MVAQYIFDITNLCLSLLDLDRIEERIIYTDILQAFLKTGHNLYVLSHEEKRH